MSFTERVNQDFFEYYSETYEASTALNFNSKNFFSIVSLYINKLFASKIFLKYLIQ